MIKKYAKFYLELMKFGINLKMVYRLNFWLNCVTDIVYYTVNLLVFLTIYNNVDNINGWDKYQVMFFLGTFFLIDSIAMVTYFFGVISIPEHIRTGKLDLFITKPINTLFYVSMNNFEFTFAINILYGLIMVVYSWAHLNITITLSKILGYIALTILMYLLYFTIMVIVNSSAFWFVKIHTLQSLNSELFRYTYRIPGIVYKGIIKIIFIIVIPYGLIATIPTQFATSFMSGEYWLITISVSLMYWILCLFIWRKGLRRYNSASC